MAAFPSYPLTRPFYGLAAFSLLISLSLLFCGCVVCDSPKTVSMNLSARWGETSLLLETAEFLAHESRDKFWQFVDRVVESSGDDADDSFPVAIDSKHYEKMLTVASSLITPLQLRYLKFALALRTFSPKVAMHAQLSQFHHRVNSSDASCDTFALVQGRKACDAAAMLDLVSSAERSGVPATASSPSLFDFDHVHPASEAATSGGVVAILHGFFGAAAFKPFHEALSQLSRDKRVTYALRHLTPSESQGRVRLSGYGVELAVKSTEYKAQDDTKVKAEWDGAGEGVEDELNGFRFTSLANKHPELIDKLAEFRKHLVDSTYEMAPLKVWEVQDLSLQASLRILESPPEGALKLLQELSQNFPRLARSLSKIPVKKEVKKEMRKNQAIWESTMGIEAGETALFLSGIKIDLAELDIFSLLETLKSETTVLEGLHAFGFRGSDVGKLAALELKTGQEKYALDIRENAVVFLNDLEVDERYRGWPGSVQDLLRPSFPGMMRHVRKNFHHVVFFLNPVGRDATTKGLIKHAESFLVHSTPLRIGVVLVSNAAESVDGKDDASVAAVRLFNYFLKEHDAQRAMSFLSDLADVADDVLTPERVMEFYRGRAPDDVFGVHSKHDKARLAAAGFYKRSGIATLPQVLHNGVALSASDLEPDAFEDALVYGVLKQTNSFQLQVYNNEITDDTDLLEYLMDQDHVVPRLNADILDPADAQSLFTSMIPKGSSSSSASSSSVGWNDVLPTIRYIYKSDPSELAHPPILTHLLVADFDSVEGSTLLNVASRHLKKAGVKTRFGLVHRGEAGRAPGPISVALQTALDSFALNTAKSLVNKILRNADFQEFLRGPEALPAEGLSVHGVDLAEFKAKILQPSPKVLESIRLQRDFIGSELNLAGHGAAAAVVSNGRVLRLPSNPADGSVDVSVDDFALIERILVGGMEKIQMELQRLSASSDEERPAVNSDLYMRLASLMLPNVQQGKRHQVHVARSALSGMEIKPETSPAEGALPSLDVVVILDPVSRAAQKLAPLLFTLRQVVPMHIKLYMNCKEKHSELPLKSFYRYTIEAAPSFHPATGALTPLTTTFTDVPKDVLFTMAMDLPEQWLVGAVHSPYDLDNIKMANVDAGGVHAEYELENILLEGHCFDSGSGQPPRGLQFVLKGIDEEDSSSSAASAAAGPTVDTIVMANLGYFQLKANPGAWVLNLRDGASSDIYAISSHENTEKLAGRSKNDVVVVIDSFKTKVVKVKVAKKSGKEGADVLGGSEEEGKGYSIWDTLSDSFGSAKTPERKEKTEAEKEEDETINIFSVATGHMYERLMRIMMMSVLKHTKSPVKFWVLKNFLSPDFKKFLPVMSATYGFKYELVEYKWPRWLHQQTEKQRVIWGYKILFLDVLFPLSVKKIIFVDADQIVRADLKELKDLDLEGNPYGYTPFCSDRKEMDGFRFWKSGYWASHLGHRKYHISALYVVDLQKFRKIAAGDRLRGQYQGLSQDPNSLSNLDQDLPNNMIHQVGIKSLPQDWLWCETWCSDKAKATAKTIDLCNNPLTKEPKLTAARRIAPEWVDYDNEIKALKEKFDAGELDVGSAKMNPEQTHSEKHTEL